MKKKTSGMFVYFFAICSLFFEDEKKPRGCLFVFCNFFFSFLKMTKNLGEVADACVHRHVGALLQEEKLPASINPIIK